MEIAPLVIFVAGLVALATGGSLAGLLATRFRAVGLVLASFVVQFAFVAWPPGWLTRTSAFVILLGAQGAVVAFLMLNRHLPGAPVILFGLLLNLVAIAANQAMPVSESAARIAGTEYLTQERHVVHGTHLRNEVMNEDTNLPWLADVIPLPVIRQVLSFGDVVIAAGLAWLVYRRMTMPDVVADQGRAKAGAPA